MTNQYGPEYQRWLEKHGKEVEVTGENLTDVVAVEQPPIKSLVVGRPDLAAYQETVLREARERVAVRERGIAMAEAEVDAAQRGYDAACELGEPTQVRLYYNQRSARRRVLKRRQNELVAAQRFLSLVEDGYLPIPRMPAIGLRWLREPLPLDVIAVMLEEKKHERFQEFRVVNGQQADRDGLPISNRRGVAQVSAGRDPILVGLCDDEMFPLAWWR